MRGFECTLDLQKGYKVSNAPLNYERGFKCTNDLRERVGNPGEAIEEDDDSDEGDREKPAGVETKPCEVDANLLTKVAPDKKTTKNQTDQT